MTEAVIEIVESLSSVQAGEWNRLAGTQPFLQYAYLEGLERSGCVGGRSGWQPCHVLLKRADALAGALPLYLKTHSYGEYVFDWAWADAYAQHGLMYYPKLLTAVPFTPVPGRRLLASSPADQRLLIAAALALARERGASSWHVLFPTEDEAQLLAEHGLMARQGIQFHWRNAGYASFDDYLGAMSHDKRKKIKQERRKVREAGIVFEHRVGAEIRAQDLAFFYECYRNTYRAHRASPYLNPRFFEHLRANLPEHLMLVLGTRAGLPIAAALNVFDDERLYGRYWGTVEFISGLHFETCYYQAIEFAIARRLRAFEGGAQGEHKLARGLLPVPTRSAHWLAHPEFARAVEQFLAREGRGVAQYVDELRDSSPFRAQQEQA